MNKHIIILHPHLLKPSGSTQVVLELARHLQARGRQVVIVTVAYDQAVVAPYQPLSILTLGGPTTGSPFFWIRFPYFFYKLVKVLRQYPEKIIFSHSLALYWGGLYKWFYPATPTVHYYHDLGIAYVDTADEIASLPLLPRLVAYCIAPVLRLVDRTLTKRVDALVANSNFTAAYLKKIYHRSVASIIYPAVNGDLFYTTNQPKQDYVYTVGRLERVKQIDLIIQGFALFIKQQPLSPLALYVIGSGVERAALQKLSEQLGIVERIKFIGSCSQAQVAQLARQAKLGLFMRPNEPFGMAALESLLSGTPIIGSCTGGINEIICQVHNSMAVAAHTPQALADSMQTVLANPEQLQQWSKQVRDQALNQFNWDSQVMKLIELFDTLSI